MLFSPDFFCIEVFIQERLLCAAVVLEGTRFSTTCRTVSLKSAQSCSVEVVNVKFAAKASVYKILDDPL